MKAATRIVIVAIANGLCGAVLAVAAAMRLVGIGVVIAIAVTVMAATWILLRRAILDKQIEDEER